MEKIYIKYIQTIPNNLCYIKYARGIKTLRIMESYNKQDAFYNTLFYK